MNFELGNTVGQYRLEARCGTGAAGDVFVAEGFHGERVALKLIHCDSRRAQEEIAGLLKFHSCRHPNLIAVYEIADLPEGFFYTMPLADNRAMDDAAYRPDTLAARIAEEKLSSGELEIIVREIVEGLNFLHQRRLLHRDLKPENVLFVKGKTVIADIGLVAADENAEVAGTPGFVPQEVVQGKRKMGKEDDFYALGKIIYCALTGEPPQKFPSLPHSLPDRTAENLLRAAIAACSPPGIGSGEAFLHCLTSPPHRVKNNGEKLLAAFGVLLLIAAGIAGGIVWRAHRLATPPQPQTQKSPAPEKEIVPSVKARDADFARTENSGDAAEITEEERIRAKEARLYQKYASRFSNMVKMKATHLSPLLSGGILKLPNPLSYLSHHDLQSRGMTLPNGPELLMRYALSDEDETLLKSFYERYNATPETQRIGAWAEIVQNHAQAALLIDYYQEIKNDPERFEADDVDYLRMLLQNRNVVFQIYHDARKK